MLLNQKVQDNQVLSKNSTAGNVNKLSSYPSQFTKSSSAIKSKNLLDQLIHPNSLVKRIYDQAQFNKSYTLCKVQQIEKRIRTEENDLYQFHKKTSEQQIKTPYQEFNRNIPTVYFKPSFKSQQVLESEIPLIIIKNKTKSHSPIISKTNQISAMIQILAQKMNNSCQQTNTINQPKSNFLTNDLTNPGRKKTFQQVRNQSADFQMLIKPSQSNEPKSNSKRTLVYDESKLHNIQKNQFHEYYKGIVQNHDKPRQDKHTQDRNASDKTTNQVIRNTKRQHNSLDSRIQQNKTQNNPLITFKLTLAQFKEKLGTIGFSKGKNQISPKQPSEPATQKKMPQSLVNEDGKVLQPDGMIFNLPKTLEGKIDVMCQEINYLKKKSDLLEIQNKILFDNLLKIQQDRESNSKEREYVLVKLDQMIDTQKRQEDNLTFFKTIFQSQCISQSGVFESDPKII